MVLVTLDQLVPTIPCLMPEKGDVVTDQYAMTPKQALTVIEAAGVDDAAKLIRDHAAAGLVRSYAQLQVTIAADGGRQELRGGRIQPAPGNGLLPLVAKPTCGAVARYDYRVLI